MLKKIINFIKNKLNYKPAKVEMSSDTSSNFAT